MPNSEGSRETTDFALTHRLQPALAGQAPHPALLLLHGRGADEQDLLALGRELDPRLFTIAARAPFRFPGGGFAWFDLPPLGAGQPEERGLQTSLSLLRRFLTQIVAAYPIDRQRFYIGGFSMGAMMAGTLALLEPERLAGAIMLSGFLAPRPDLPFRLAEAAAHPFFQAHGTFDPVIPLALARQTRDYLAGTAVNLTYREYPMGHEVSVEELSDLRRWLQPLLDRG